MEIMFKSISKNGYEIDTSFQGGRNHINNTLNKIAEVARWSQIRDGDRGHGPESSSSKKNPQKNQVEVTFQFFNF